MGVDWYCTRPRPDSNHEEICALIEQQSQSFQAMPGYWLTESLDDIPRSVFEESENLYRPTYLESSRTLADLLELPEFDEDTDSQLNYLDIDPIRRTYFITRNELFPPQWQVRSYRTFLPEELPTAYDKWATWVEGIRSGRQRGYSFALWCFHESLDLRSHWSILQHAARASLEKTNAWTRKPKFLEARASVLDYPEPRFYSAPIWVPPDGYCPPYCLSTQRAIEEEAEKLINMTRKWDSTVKGSWKVRMYRDHHETFEQYLARADAERLVESLAWVEQCCSMELGLYLDY